MSANEQDTIEVFANLLLQSWEILSAPSEYNADDMYTLAEKIDEAMKNE